MHLRKSQASIVAACAFACAAAALAGPDVIVGDLPDVTSYGGTGGLHAWAVGTTSCNLGDTPLTWIDCTSGSQCNVHPVISQNLYRLSNGRYEQIGQAWLKHGFCALQGTVCSACTPGGSCDALYPGCSDPYSSGLNGGQSGLGPKSEVNAASGAFPYPWVNNGCGTTGTLCKRLQALDTDTQTAGALYFVACMYVQPEDAASHNNNNNESYRRVTFDASYNIALTDSTQRTKPGIQAWKDNGLGAGVIDPDVYITNVDVINDGGTGLTGRFIIGAKATSLGGGQWHYEYAVENLNSDRAAGSFSIPLPASATVTNIGFHSVPYHSGEPYSNTAWSGAASSSAVTWSCPQTYAQNANASALRWDTLYNFRFDCNIPPAGVTGTLGVFKPGTPASVSGSTVGPSGDGTQHPINDACANASVIGNGATAFSTVGATTDGPTECTASNYSQIGSDIWFLWTNGACAGNATVTTCGSTFDTKIAVYSAACPTGAGTALACNDDSATCGTSSLQSSVTFSATANTTYRLRVGGYASGANAPATGTGTLTITAPGGCGPQPPANDACANAQWLADGVSVNGDTTLATYSASEGTSSCGQSGTSADVWFKYKPVSAGAFTVDTCGSSANPLYDTVLTAYTGSCGAFTEVVCNDDASPSCSSHQYHSRISVTGVANTTYYIRLAGYNGSTGIYHLTVTGGGGVIPPTPPANDNCANRAGVSTGTTNFNTAGATTDGIAHACGQINNDIWYNFPTATATRVRIDTCGSSFDTKLALYAHAGCTSYATRLISCVDNTAGCANNGAAAYAYVGPGDNVTIRIGAAVAGVTGAGTLHITRYCVADCDDGTGTGTPDGGVTIDDLLYYLGLFQAGSLAADVDDGSGTGTPDGGVTIDDLLFYLGRFAAGC